MDAEQHINKDEFKAKNTPFSGSHSEALKQSNLSPQRIKYEAQVQVIRSRIGGLEVVRARLGLSQRKICQLLMVDPSAWNRWLKDDSAPPHIWRMLEWYLGLQDKLPGLSPQFFLGEFTQTNHLKQIKELQLQIQKIQTEFLSAQENQIKENLILKKELQKWHKNAMYLVVSLVLFIVLFAFQMAKAESKSKELQTKTNSENQTYYKDNNETQASDGNILNSDAVQKQAVSGNQKKNTKSVTMPIGYYTPETSLAFGLLHLHNYNQATPGKTSNSLSHLSYTLKKQTLFNSTAKFYLDQGKYEWGTQLIYRYFPDEYYGSNISAFDSSQSEGEKFTEKVLIAGVTGGYQFFPDFYLRTMFQQDHRVILKDNALSTPLLDAQLERFTSTLNTTVMQYSFDFDDRDFVQSAKSGNWFKLNFTHYFSKTLQGENLHPIVKSEIEYRKYYSFDEKQILATQILASQVKSHQSNSIPFYYLNSIGGGSRLRGYYNGRYRDQSLILTQIDYRYEWNDRWVSTLFYSAAKMGEEFKSITNKNDSIWLSSAGFGVNYFIDPQNRTKLRLDMGFVAEKRSIYFLIGDAI